MASKEKEDEEDERETVVSKNPASLETNAEIDAATPEEVDEAIAAAKEAQRDWKRKPVDERLEVLKVFQE
ncbi:MAG: aldehyde dehydrogenase family protein, partial [Halobacteria archaeon]|nr:aldehyde dehydrogenase family protein [Halobacteria archaeon]